MSFSLTPPPLDPVPDDFEVPASFPPFLSSATVGPVLQDPGEPEPRRVLDLDSSKEASLEPPNSAAHPPEPSAAAGAASPSPSPPLGPPSPPGDLGAPPEVEPGPSSPPPPSRDEDISSNGGCKPADPSPGAQDGAGSAGGRDEANAAGVQDDAGDDDFADDFAEFADFSAPPPAGEEPSSVGGRLCGPEGPSLFRDCRVGRTGRRGAGRRRAGRRRTGQRRASGQSRLPNPPSFPFVLLPSNPSSGPNKRAIEEPVERGPSLGELLSSTLPFVELFPLGRLEEEEMAALSNLHLLIGESEPWPDATPLDLSSETELVKILQRAVCNSVNGRTY